MDLNQEDLFDLDDALREADANLTCGGQHPNDREARREVESTAGWLAHLERPTGHGPGIDRLFWPASAQAKSC